MSKDEGFFQKRTVPNRLTFVARVKFEKRQFWLFTLSLCFHTMNGTVVPRFKEFLRVFIFTTVALLVFILNSKDAVIKVKNISMFTVINYTSFSRITK